MRRPFVIGSIAGDAGTVTTPEILRTSSPGGGNSFDATIFALLAVRAPPTFVHGSHASPTPSPSASACSAFGTSGQSSIASQTPSPSRSAHPSIVLVVVDDVVVVVEVLLVVLELVLVLVLDVDDVIGSSVVVELVDVAGASVVL